MAQRITFRRADREDLPSISKFQKAFFPYYSLRTIEPEYYEWKCYQNPVLPGEMWLAESGQELVGIKNITPRRMKFQGGIITGAEVGDSFTRPDFERQGIFTALTKEARESLMNKGVSLIYNTPGPASLPAYRKYLDHEVVPIKLRRMIKPLYPKRLFTGKLRSAKLATFLALATEVVSRAILRFGTKGTKGSDISVSCEEAIPSDIDDLWQRASNGYDVIVHRNRQYLHWRYIANPDTYSFLVARNSDRVIVGYMVTKIVSSEKLRTGFIVDFLTVEDDPTVFKRLLSSSLAGHFGKRLDIVQTWGITGSFYDRILLRSGFFPYSRIVLACYKNDAGNQALKGNLKWHFTMGDADAV